MNTLTCIYGETLHGKSTLLSSAIRYFYTQDPTLKVRLYTAENYEVLMPWVKKGVLDVWTIDTRPNPFDSVVLAARGYWPRNVDDPESPLVAPTQEDFKKISLWLYEGMATYSDYLMGGYAHGGLAARSGRGERIGPAEETIHFTDGQSRIGGNPRTHYNIVQRWIHGAVNHTRQLPGHVIWTSHEVVARDDRSGKPILGPEITGTAATSSCVRWFGNTLHALRVDAKVVDKKTKATGIDSEYRLYLKAHYAPEMPNTPYKAVIRVPAEIQDEANEIIPEYLVSGKETYTELMEVLAQVEELSLEAISNIS